MTSNHKSILPQTVCIGAGPAGLTGAYQLTKAGYPVTVLEKDPQYVGGISRTVRYRGFGFDIGGHRFFSKSREVEQLWKEILQDDFIIRQRKSRIYHGGNFYPYPLKVWPTLRQIGPITAAACILSYIYANLTIRKKPVSFEDYMIKHFGRRLYQLFFKTYTEKVWGIPCTEISADWAVQRIKGLSLFAAVIHSVFSGKYFTGNRKVVKTLINTFRYPRLGPGMMWEKTAELVKNQDGSVIMDAAVTGVILDSGGKWLVSYRSSSGKEFTVPADYVITSMPLSSLIGIIKPSLPAEALAAAKKLHYREFLVVALIVRDKNIFDDNWLYIHDPEMKVGRIQNFKSWSPYMVPDPELNCYGMEYFCFEGDGLWDSSDEELIELARAELVELQLASREDILDGVVVRQPKAYPVYDKGYQENVGIIRKALAEHCPNLYPVGRAGMHKYNNQDHSMMTAMLAVKNILSGEELYDIWKVNQDAEYHEEIAGAGASGLRAVPMPK